MEHRQISAQLAEDAFTAARRRTPAEIEHHLGAIQPSGTHALQQALAVIAQQIRSLLEPSVGTEAAEDITATMQAGFDLSLLLLGQLGAAGTKDLDPVVMGRVMAGRNHQTATGTELSNGPRHGGGGTQTDIQHLSPRGREARGQGSHQHRTATAGVHPQHDGPAGGQDSTAPVANLQRQGRCDHLTDAATDAIGAKTRRTRREWRPKWRHDGRVNQCWRQVTPGLQCRRSPSHQECAQ